MSLSAEELRNVLNTGNYSYSPEDAALLQDSQHNLSLLKKKCDDLRKECESGPVALQQQYATGIISEWENRTLLDDLNSTFWPLSVIVKKAKVRKAKEEKVQLDAKISELNQDLANTEAQYNKCSDTIKSLQDKYRAQAENPLLELMGYKIKDYNRLSSSLSLGSYGEEKLDWDIIYRDGNKLLLFAHRSLFIAPFHNKNEPTVWATSTLRKYLNGNFYQSVFSDAEKSYICKTTVPAVEVAGVKSPQTSDYLFLLSCDEIKKYLPNERDALRFDDMDLDAGVGRLASYWLRDPGENSSCGTVLEYRTFQGALRPVYSIGINVTDPNGSVCPAMWISL